MSKTKVPASENIAHHKEHCPCGGKRQPTSDRLQARKLAVPSSGKMKLGNGTEGFFRKPGSQNRKK